MSEMSIKEQVLDDLITESMRCPVSHELFKDPVKATDGHTYEKECLELWLRTHTTSPITREIISMHSTHPDYTMRKIIKEWVERMSKKVPKIIPFGELVVGPQVGMGSFKVVHKAAWQGQDFALLSCRNGAKMGVEMSIMMKLSRYDHVLRLYGTTQDPGTGVIHMVTEFAPHGSLSDALCKLEDKRQKLSFAVVLAIAVQVCEGMLALVGSNVVHCDLACRNVLLFSPLVSDNPIGLLLKIADYGMSILFYGTINTTTAGGGSAPAAVPDRYMAPESLSRNSWSEKSDVWAFAVLLYEVLTGGCIPYNSLDVILTDQEVRKGVTNGSLRLPRPPSTPDVLWDLMCACWAQHPADRPTFREVRLRLYEMELALKEGKDIFTMAPQEKLKTQHTPSPASTSKKGQNAPAGIAGDNKTSTNIEEQLAQVKEKARQVASEVQAAEEAARLKRQRAEAEEARMQALSNAKKQLEEAKKEVEEQAQAIRAAASSQAQALHDQGQAKVAETEARIEALLVEIETLRNTTKAEVQTLEGQAAAIVAEGEAKASERVSGCEEKLAELLSALEVVGSTLLELAEDLGGSEEEVVVKVKGCGKEAVDKLVAEVQLLVHPGKASRIAASSSDASINLWDRTTGRLLANMKGHTNIVTRVAVSPDHSLLASASWDHTIRLWDLTTHKCVRTLSKHTATVCCVAFSPDGTLLASGGDDKKVCVWQLSDGECVATLDGHTGEVECVAFSSDGAILASGGGDNTVRLWDMTSKQCKLQIAGHTARVRDVLFHVDGTRLTSCGDDKTIKLWDASTGACQATMSEHGGSVIAVCFSPDGSLLASASDDTSIKVWDVENRQCSHTLTGHTSGVVDVAFDFDGQAVVSASWDNTVRVWCLGDTACVQTFTGDGFKVADWAQGIVLMK